VKLPAMHAGPEMPIFGNSYRITRKFVLWMNFTILRGATYGILRFTAFRLARPLAERKPLPPKTSIARDVQ
jgi:hypothetical protein